MRVCEARDLRFDVKHWQLRKFDDFCTEIEDSFEHAGYVHGDIIAMTFGIADGRILPGTSDPYTSYTCSYVNNNSARPFNHFAHASLDVFASAHNYKQSYFMLKPICKKD